MAYNKDIGGHPRSLHVYDFSHHGLDGTAAIDIAFPAKPADRVDMLFAALKAGFSAGVAKWGLHLDRRDTAGLPQAIFGY